MCSLYIFTDYSVGFGGKFGVQSDRQDKSAVGWDYAGKTEKHTSQKGKVQLSQGGEVMGTFYYCSIGR